MKPKGRIGKKSRASNGSPRRGGQLAKSAEPALPTRASSGEIVRLTQDLQIHQEELEIQNRQLVESQRLLEESRDRYANLYDFAPVPYVTLCPNGVIREINLTGAHLLGQARARLIDRPFVLFVVPTYRRSFLSHLAQCKQGMRPLTTELMLKTAQGKQAPVELRTSEGTINENGRADFPSVLIDLSDRHRLEQERDKLRTAAQSEQLLRTILQSLPVAVRVVDTTGQSLLLNEACRAVWGIPSGAPTPPLNHQTGSDAQSRQRLMSDEWPISQAIHGSNTTLRRMIHITGYDGKVRVVIQSALPLLEESGTATGAIEVTEDVSPLISAQETARRRKEQLEAAFDAARLGFWEWDVAADRVDWSGPFEQLFASQGADSSGRPADFLRRVHLEDVSAVKEAIVLARDKRLPLEHEFRVIEPGGSVRWLLAKGRFAYRSDRPVAMAGVLTDVTARKLAEIELRKAKEAAEEASRLKDDFLATVSHELRTPLSGILLWAHLARSTMTDEQERNAALDTILQSAKSQAQIVDDLLDISRGIAGKLRLNLQPASLAQPVQAAIDSVRPSAQARQIELTADIAEDLPAVQIDVDRIQQVAWNLLSNAIKFTPPGGRVAVAISMQQNADATQSAQLSVTDTGSGIAPEFLPHIFDRFRQAESGTTRGYGGLGLGLAIARELVQMHGGTIVAQSSGLGQGTTFIVDLPLRTAALADHPSDSPRAPGESLEGMDVLIVEDDSDTRVALGQLLESAGATVRTAPSAAAAVDAFCEHRPDALVSDIAMPEQDGYVLMRRLRQIELDVRTPRRGSRPRNGAARRPVPAVALTAHARPEDRAKAIDAGYQTHLAKPVDPANLISAVAALCRPGHRPETASKRG